MDELKKEEVRIQDLIEVEISSDGMTAFIKLIKNEEEEPPVFEKEDLMAALSDKEVVFGINEAIIEKLAARPIFNLRMKVADGRPKENGINGSYHCLIQRDEEFRPVFDDEEKIDYKNVSSFQIVDKDQTLCTIEKETAGTDGTDVFGKAITAKAGQKPSVKEGKNTYFTEDGKELRSSCEGVVKYVGHLITVNNILHVQSNVDITTGNIDFAGDVTIDGDVCCGFRVKTRGNLVIKGVVEEADIEAEGNVHVAKGINSGRHKKIKIGKTLRSKYIENSQIEVGGEIYSDYIIDSVVKCGGNIKLSGEQEVIAGGQVEVGGELSVKDIGTDREYPTTIRITGVPKIDQEKLKKYEGKLAKKQEKLQELVQGEKAALQIIEEQKKARDRTVFERMSKLYRNINEQKVKITGEIEQLNSKIDTLKEKAPLEFFGSIICRRRLYQGVKIVFGDEIFKFESDFLEHSHIYWDKGEIIQGMV